MYVYVYVYTYVSIKIQLILSGHDTLLQSIVQLMYSLYSSGIMNIYTESNERAA